MKTLILGVGNPILCNDGVGLYVAQQVKQQVNNPDVTIEEAFTGGMNLLDLIVGYDKVIIIDAVIDKKGKNGIVKRYHPTELSTVHSCNPHDVSFIEALTVAKKLGEEHLPQDIVVIGISLPERSCEFGEHLSESIAAAVPQAVKMVLAEIITRKKNEGKRKQNHVNT